jgi:hypothetical protein
VGNVERVVHTQAGGKEELLRNALRSNMVNRCAELGGGGTVENYGSSERWRCVYGRGKQVVYGGECVQSNMCSSDVRSEIVTTRGCTCSGISSWSGQSVIIMCGKVRLVCEWLCINAYKNGIVICREKGYVQTLIVGVGQFSRRERSRCLLKCTRDSRYMTMTRISYNLEDIGGCYRTVVRGVMAFAYNKK